MISSCTQLGNDYCVNLNIYYLLLITLIIIILEIIFKNILTRCIVIGFLDT